MTSDVWSVGKHENPFSGEITEWIVRNGTYADLEEVVVVLRAQQEEIERLRSLVQCCERDYDYDGNCDVHLERPKVSLPPTEYFYERAMERSQELKEHGGDGK